MRSSLSAPSFGYMEKRPELHDNWPYRTGFGTSELPLTRPEEYAMALSKIAGTTVLDAACGWHPQFHLLPELTVEVMPDAYVTAMDANPEVLYNFESHPRILRMLGDICGMPFADNSFDTVVCISTLEHLPPSYQQRAVREIVRVAKEKIIVTADPEGSSLPEHLAQAFSIYAVELGEKVEASDPLVNGKGDPVAYLIARKQHD